MSGLTLESLKIPRAGVTIVRGVEMVAPLGQVTVLLGPNGAGKTTLIDALSGLIPSSSGKIQFEGQDITKASRVKRARRGLSHVEQGRAVFGELTVRENIRLTGVDPDEFDAAIAYFPELEPRLDIAAGRLSGGEQQMLVLARALASKPKMLLVDEASLGLAPGIVRRLMPVFRQLADAGLGVLLVEQFAALALSIGDRVYVLNRGEIRLSAECSELAAQPERLHEAYLGADAAPASRNGSPPTVG
jgi:branched-chain amino acid transport system ATP-binding protein